MKKLNTKIRSALLQEASSWLVEFSEGEVDAAGRDAFTQWLRISPEHVRAYLQVSALWEEAPLVAKHRSEDHEALIARALADLNVISLGTARAEVDSTPETEIASSALGMPPPKAIKSLPFANGHRRMIWGIAASLVLAAGTLAAWVILNRGVYSTEVGEQRLITLADGSTVELNARSHLRVHFTKTERSVYLTDGEALFQVAHNASQPFVVHSGSMRVRAVGTAFDVYRKKAGTTVTVVEGRVAVLATDNAFEDDRASSPAGMPHERRPIPGEALPMAPRVTPSGALINTGGEQQPARLFLAAGEEVTYSAQAQLHPRKADVSAATAWTQRRLVFNSTPLSEAVEQYNRYNVRPLIIRDPALTTLNISGVFSVTDSASLIAFLRAQPGVRVHATDAGLEITGE